MVYLGLRYVTDLIGGALVGITVSLVVTRAAKRAEGEVKHRECLAATNDVARAHQATVSIYVALFRLADMLAKRRDNQS
jgi:hypothetical protein